MKKYFGLLLAIVVLLSFSVAAYSEEATDTDTATSTSTETATSTATGTSTGTGTATATETKSLVPDSTSMTLGMASTDNVLPADFRGGDPDSGLVSVLEDVYYEKHEHSLIYNENADEIASDAKFVSQPNITWETTKLNEDGSTTVTESKNSNVASDGGTFYEPGEYQIGNGGARQVESDDEKTVTANQSMGVIAYDCTSPDVWVAIQEGAGSIDMASTETELKAAIASKVVESLGRPFSVKSEDYEEVNYLFIDEGDEDERDLEPWNKTARVSVGGALFNAEGALKFETATVNSALLDEEKQLRQVHLEGGEDSFMKGIFVRQNVPFIFTAVAADNYDNRKSFVEVECRIEDAKTGAQVSKSDGNAYLFRVPNYTRTEYSDQPDYVFVARAEDLSGNVTTIRVPLYVVPVVTAYEGSKNN